MLDSDWWNHLSHGLMTWQTSIHPLLAIQPSIHLKKPTVHRTKPYLTHLSSLPPARRLPLSLSPIQIDAASLSLSPIQIDAASLSLSLPVAGGGALLPSPSPPLLTAPPPRHESRRPTPSPRPPRQPPPPHRLIHPVSPSHPCPRWLRLCLLSWEVTRTRPRGGGGAAAASCRSHRDPVRITARTHAPDAMTRLPPLL